MGVPADLDHLVVTCADLDAGMAWAERTFGVMPVRGGAHPQWGTHNALLSLGRGRYLELLAPDPLAGPAGRANDRGRALFGLAPAPEAGAAPRLTTWMVRSRTIETLLGGALKAGADLGRVQGGSRLRTDDMLARIGGDEPAGGDEWPEILGGRYGHGLYRKGGPAWWMG